MATAETPNYDRVGRGLKITQNALTPFIYRELMRVYHNKWWTEGVLLGVSDAQRNSLPQVGQTKDLVDRLDPAARLNLITRRWNDVFGKELDQQARTYVNELISVRNNWAHSASKDWAEDDAWRALDTMTRLLEQVQRAAAREVEALAKEVRAATYAAPLPPAPAIKTPAAPAAPAAAGSATTLQPWRKVIIPHDDVARGKFQQAQFAADLAQVLAGKATSEYQDPVEFFQRTFLTEGTRLLLTAVERLAGKGGEPVIQLKTSFGAGEVLAGAAVTKLPNIKIAVLVGTDLDATAPHLAAGGKGIQVRTLWSEMAAQLGGRPAYERLQRADLTSVAPGAATLVKLFDDVGPCVVLIDELVAYARRIYNNPNQLPSGSFESVMTFIQSLTEAAKRSRASMVVASIPESDVEIGAEGGKETLSRIEHTFGRLEAVWKPVGAREAFEVVRRRLFGPVRDEAAREAVCLAYSRLYAGHSTDFPGECRQADYLDRLRAAYPIHPEVFDRLYDDWSTLERFQRTRGVLRLLAAAIHALWERNDRSLLIQPGTLPLDVPRLRDDLQRYLSEGWNAVIDHDVDGPHCQPRKIDEENPRLGQLVAAGRVERAIFLGSAPHVAQQSVRGIDDAHVRLGVAQPGESLAVFNDAIGRLTEQLTYLYVANKRYWFDIQPNLRREADDRARRLEGHEVTQEIIARLRQDAAPREAGRRSAERGVFHAVHWPSDRSGEPVGGDVPDEQFGRLVVLPPSAGHRRGQEQSAARTLATLLLERRGNAARLYRNTLLFLAPDADGLPGLDAEVRRYLAWKSIKRDSDALNLDRYRQREADEGIAHAEQTFDLRLRETYSWLLVPRQDTASAWLWEEVRLPAGEGSLVQRAAQRAEANEYLYGKISPFHLQRVLDDLLWKDAPHLSLRKFWEYLCTYGYLPRLRDSDVLLEAVAQGLRTRDYFGYADAVSDDGSYRGLVFGEARTAGSLTLDASSVLVKPSAALAGEERRQREEAQRRQEQDAARATTEATWLPGTTGGAVPAGTAPSGDPGDAPTPTPPARQRVLRRYHGTMELDPLRLARDVRSIAEETLQNLSALPNASVRVTLQIDVDAPDGIPEQAVRTVVENSRTLKLPPPQFEQE